MRELIAWELASRELAVWGSWPCGGAGHAGELAMWKLAVCGISPCEVAGHAELAIGES